MIASKGFFWNLNAKLKHLYNNTDAARLCCLSARREAGSGIRQLIGGKLSQSREREISR